MHGKLWVRSDHHNEPHAHAARLAERHKADLGRSRLHCMMEVLHSFMCGNVYAQPSGAAQSFYVGSCIYTA